MNKNYTSLVLTCIAFLSLAFFSNQAKGQCPPVTNITFFNSTGSTVDMTWLKDPSHQSFVVEWGPCGFIPGTGNYLHAGGNDTVTITGIGPGFHYDFYVQSTCATSSSYQQTSFSSSCGNVGDHHTTPIIAQFDTAFTGGSAYKRWSWVEYSTKSCLSDQYTYSASKDLAIQYDPHPLATSISIEAAFGLDSSGIIVLDSAYNMIARSTVPLALPGGITQGAAISNLAIDPSRTYYIIVEAADADTTTMCSDNASVLIDENWTACPTFSAVVDTFMTSCDVISLYWLKNGIDTFDLEYGPTGFQLGTGIQSSQTDTFLVASSLTPNTTYDFYIRSSCSPTTVSYVGPLTYSTRTGQATAVSSFTSSLINTTATSETYEFDGSASTADSLIWYFGDGSPVEVGNVVTHAYTQYGTFNVVCVAVDGCSTDSGTAQVIVQPNSMDESQLQKLSIYPNPTVGLVHLELPTGVSKNASIQLISLEGQVLRSWKLASNNGGDTMIIDIHDLAKGAYILKLSSDSEGYIARLILE